MATLLYKMRPMVIFEISNDIDASHKSVKFGSEIGLNMQEIELICRSLDANECAASRIMRAWFRKSPNVFHLANVLCNLSLEKPLERLEPYIPEEIYKGYLQRLLVRRRPVTMNDDYLEFNDTENSNIEFQDECNITVESYNENPTLNGINNDIHSPFADRDLCKLTSRAKSPTNLHDCEETVSDIILFKSILKQKANSFLESEFEASDITDKTKKNLFSTYFHKKLRGIVLNVQSISLEKISESKKKQQKLYNIIWSLTNFKLYSFPILTGFCFVDNHLFLVYPGQNKKSLFDILHRSHSSSGDVISAQRRLTILRVIGESLNFLHSFKPFPVYHGQVISENVHVSSDTIVLSGFEKLHTADTDYLRGLETINKYKIKTKDYKRKDILEYLELICETWWSVQPCRDQYLTDYRNKDRGQTYPGWSQEMNDGMCQVIAKYSDCESNSSIAQILDDLLRVEQTSEG